ncbi:MAG: BrnT family toxin [Gammaproteobacteria bacterium]|nr:BrnT family toxin [Gammaproteobacteria bacterium]
MELTWDPAKAAANLAKHGVRFADAETVLYDPDALTVEDTDAEGEHRYASIGTDAMGRILVVVYSYRGNRIRLISARRASKKERRAYEEGI